MTGTLLSIISTDFALAEISPFSFKHQSVPKLFENTEILHDDVPSWKEKKQLRQGCRGDHKVFGKNNYERESAKFIWQTKAANPEFNEKRGKQSLKVLSKQYSHPWKNDSFGVDFVLWQTRRALTMAGARHSDTKLWRPWYHRREPNPSNIMKDLAQVAFCEKRDKSMWTEPSWWFFSCVFNCFEEKENLIC